MAYGYGYGGYPAANGYYAPPVADQLATLRANQYQQPMMQTQQPIQTAQTATTAPQPVSNGINWCQGEEGAKAWLVAPGTTVMLMDSDGSSFYLKSADASGMPQPLRIFDYVERTAKTPVQPVQSANAPAIEYVTKDDFNALAARYDAMAAELAALKEKSANRGKKSTKEDAE